MNNEFKKINNNNITRYVLEDGSSGGATSGSTNAGSIPSFEKPMGGIQRRTGNNLINQENKKNYKVSHKPKNPVAKAHQTVGTGSGSHKDKTKVLPRQEKHKKSADMTMENFNAEYNDEAGMSYGSLHTINRAATGLLDTIKQGDDLPEWCQEKISLAEDYLVTVWDYLQSEKEQGISEGVMSEIDYEIGEMMGKYIKKYQDGLLDADHFMSLISKASAIIARNYKMDPTNAQQLVSDYVEQAIGEQGVAEGFQDFNKVEPYMKENEEQWDSGEDVTVTQDDQNTTYQYKGCKFVVNGEEAQGEAWWYEPGDTWRDADHYNYVYDESKGINRFYNEDGQNVFNLSATNQNKVEQFVKAKAQDFVSTMVAQPNAIRMHEQDVAEGNQGYAHGFASPTAPQLGQKRRDSDSGDREPADMFTVMIDGRPWKEFTSNMAFDRAKAFATKNPDRKVQVRWPSGQLNTVKEDNYMESLNAKLAEKLDPNAEPEVWVQDFQQANPNKYHQFKNKTPQKKAQMAVAARRDARLNK